MAEAASKFNVTVVIPLYDKAPFVADSLASVLAQSLSPREVIVIDDQSTDGGAEIVESFAARHPDAPIRLIRQPNAGPGPTRNRGVLEAAAEWIALLDADDLWGPDHLATLADVAGAFPEADVVATQFMQGLRAAGPQALRQAVERPAPRLIEYFAESASDSRLWTSATAIRRRAFLKIGGFGSFFPGEDIELWVRLALDHAIAVSDRRTAYYVKETGGLIDQTKRPMGADLDLGPLFGSLDAALADPRRQKHYARLSKFRADILRCYVRQSLYLREPRQARQLIGLLRRSGEGMPILLQLLALLPRHVLKIVFAMRKAFR